MLKAMLSIASDLQKQFKENLRPIISKLSEGITSLPDELIATVFKFLSGRKGSEARGRRQSFPMSRVGSGKLLWKSVVYGQSYVQTLEQRSWRRTFLAAARI